MMWINRKKTLLIREFVQGVFAGIVLSGKTREEVFGSENNEYWFNWDSDVEVHVFKDDITDKWGCTAYQCNEYGQFFGNEHQSIDLGENWT